MKAVDLSPLTAALDAREWRTLRQYVTDDNLIKRIIPAARHLRRG